jgi:lipid-A-disaccharide synthase-like uncharacterized protein
VTFEKVALATLGGVGQACFFFRFLIQWLASERVKRSIVPSVFWRLSVLGSVLMALYAWLGPHDVIFAAGYVFNLVVYVRNIMLAGGSKRGLRPIPLAMIALALAGGAAWAFTHDPKVASMLRSETPFWLAFGITGQAIWSSRFLLQWIIAERRGRAELPPVFFVISLFGSLLILTYAIHVGDVFLIVGQIPGPFIYGRNLVLQARTGRAAAE